MTTCSDIAATCALIRAHHRTRVFAMAQRKRADLATGAFLRLALGWRRDLPQGERSAIAARAAALLAHGEKVFVKGKPDDLDEPDWTQWRTVIEAAYASRAPFAAIEKQAGKEMARLAQTLPVWEAFARDVRGLGAVSLAVIVGEAGPLDAYPKKGHLWKRMGLACLDGVRQGGLSKGAPAAAWVAHGYCAPRRAAMFVIGDVLVKQGEAYRAFYLARKQLERDKAEAAGLQVLPAAKITKALESGAMSEGHIHRRAQRAMEKRLLKHLWQAWRGAGQCVRADEARTALPAPRHSSPALEAA